MFFLEKLSPKHKVKKERTIETKLIHPKVLFGEEVKIIEAVIAIFKYFYLS